MPLTQPAAKAATAVASAAAGTADAGKAAAAQLPKATVKLQPTKPLAKPTGTAVQSVPVYKSASAADDEYEDEDESVLNPLAAIAVVLAAVLLLVQLFSWPSKFSPAVDSTPGTETWKIPKDDNHSWMDSSGALKELEVD
ncbi:MAG: hypothetical protein ACI9R3_003168 [Verrucomicrobiales bacterium]